MQSHRPGHVQRANSSKCRVSARATASVSRPYIFSVHFPETAAIWSAWRRTGIWHGCWNSKVKPASSRECVRVCGRAQIPSLLRGGYFRHLTMSISDVCLCIGFWFSIFVLSLRCDVLHSLNWARFLGLLLLANRILPGIVKNSPCFVVPVTTLSDSRNSYSTQWIMFLFLVSISFPLSQCISAAITNVFSCFRMDFTFSREAAFLRSV